jgi:PAS domain S-box-containing protein
VLVYLYLAVYVLIKNPRSSLNITCSALLCSLCLWTFGKIFSHNPYTSSETVMFFANVGAIGWTSYFSFFVWFCLIIAERKKILEKLFVYPILFVCPVVFIFMQWKYHALVTEHIKLTSWWKYIWADTIWPPLYFTYYLAFSFLGFFILIAFWRKTENPVKKRQAKTIFIATLIPLLTGTVTDVVFSELNIHKIPEMANLFSLIWALGLVYAVVKYRLLTITPEVAADKILTTMMDALILLDRNGHIVTANEAAQGLLGYRENDLIGRSLSSLFAKADHQSAFVRKAIKGDMIKDFELVFQTSQGNQVPVTFSSSALRDDTGTIVGTICVAHDITKRKIKEEELQLARDEAESASRIKSQFLASMSHEFRTPLNAIIGFSEVLEDKTFGDLNEKQAKYVGNILTSGRHLLQMINDVLDLSKIEAGKMELELSIMNIGELIEHSLMMVKEKCWKHRIDLTSRISEELEDLDIMADDRKLRQAMFNLLSNAVKFTPEGGKIAVEARRREREIRVSVADTGIGIKAENQRRIFGEFEQVDTRVGDKHHGTGLGLALTRRLVELHGGRIWVESEGEGKGSIFTFTIPLRMEKPLFEKESGA